MILGVSRPFLFPLAQNNPKGTGQKGDINVSKCKKIPTIGDNLKGHKIIKHAKNLVISKF